MFNVGGAELFVILLLALIVLGPDKLPGAMRTVGQWAGELRKMASGFQAEMDKAVNQAVDVKAKETTSAKAGDVTPPADASSNGAAERAAVDGGDEPAEDA